MALLGRPLAGAAQDPAKEGVDGASSAAEPPPEVNGDAVMARIYERMSRVEREFPGHFSRRSVVRREFDPDDGELRETRRFEVEVWGWNGRSDRTKILRCEIDGEVVDNEKCAPQLKAEPMHPMFGAEGRKHYDLEFGGAVERDGEKLWRIRSVPREETMRHFKGDLLVRQESLTVAALEGDLAHHPFGLKSLELALRFENKDGRGLLASGRSEIVLYVPLLVDARVETEFTARDQRALKPDEFAEFEG